MSAPEPGPIVLFDGDCAMCNGAVRFLVTRDPRQRLRFAPLQSPPGRALLHEHRLPTDELETIVLIEDGRAFVRSSAVLHAIRHLRAPWPIFAAARLVPRPLRDFVYAFVARRRFRWFGHTDQCTLPTPDWADRVSTARGASTHLTRRTAEDRGERAEKGKETKGNERKEG